MNARYFLWCLLLSQAKGITYRLSGDSVLEITCRYVDRCATEDVIIHAEFGYKVLITVKEVDIDGTSGDFLLIKSGTTIDDGLTGRIFTHYINQEREYLSLTEEVLLHFVVQGDNADNHQGFILTAEHYGDPVTTLAPTTTDRPWPTPSEDETPYITVNITINQEFTTSSFQNFVVKLATDYIQGHNFDLAEEISADNVQISAIGNCPMFWPGSGNCIEITFAVPIFLSEESEYYETYQISNVFLEEMWKNASNYIVDNSFYIYKTPDHSRVFITWMTITCSTILLVGIIYLVSGYGSDYLLKKKKTAAVKKEPLPSDENARNSVASLSPHPLQRMPRLFDTDVTFYNPDSPTVMVRNSGRTDHHDDSRDTLATGNLNLRVFSFNGQDLEDVTET